MSSEHLAPRAPTLPQALRRYIRLDAANEKDSIRRLLLGVAALSLIAALIHAWMGPEHFAEWWGYGLFFLVAAVFQAGYAVDLIREPTSVLARLGVVVNLGIIVLWAWTRTVGIPLFGPHAGEVEPVGVVDVASKLAEAGVVALLLVVLRHPAMTAPPHRLARSDRGTACLVKTTTERRRHYARPPRQITLQRARDD